jgi:hypothetical protein
MKSTHMTSDGEAYCLEGNVENGDALFAIGTVHDGRESFVAVSRIHPITAAIG